MISGGVIAHRGASGYAPENTLAAFRKACDQGARWVEFDVRLSADDELVVLHDDTLTRTTGAQGDVAQTPSELIYQLDAGSWFAPQYAGEKVPSLAQTIDCLAQCELGANLELKPVNGNYVKLAALVERFITTSWPPHLPEPVISSYCEETLHAIYRINPRRRLGLLYEQHDWLDWARRLNVFAIHKVAKTFSREDIQHYRELGYPVIVGIIDDAQQARQLFDWGVAGIFTDYPDRVMVR